MRALSSLAYTAQAAMVVCVPRMQVEALSSLALQCI